MPIFKLIFLLTIFSLFSCKTDNQNIIAKWDNGKTKLERIYSDTPNVYLEKQYYENGQLANETKFINSVKNGESVSYYEDGKLLGKLIYKNGNVNGEVIEFHKNGNLMFKENQVDGNLVGIAMYYYDNGEPERELFFRDNKVVLANYWDSSGMQQIKNENGVRKFKDYLHKDENGNEIAINVFVIGSYKDRLPSGIWKYYGVIDHK